MEKRASSNLLFNCGLHGQVAGQKTKFGEQYIPRQYLTNTVDADARRLVMEADGHVLLQTEVCASLPFHCTDMYASHIIYRVVLSTGTGRVCVTVWYW